MRIGCVGESINGTTWRNFERDFGDDELVPRRQWLGWRPTARIDPFSYRFDFAKLEFFSLTWRHDLVFAIALDLSFDHLHQQAFIALAGNDGGPILAAFHERFEIFEHELGLGI